MSETTIEAWILLPTAQECVLAGAGASKNAAVSAWLREDREGAWDRSAQDLLDAVHADPSKLAMALKIGKAATAREVGCLLRYSAAHALLAAQKNEGAQRL